MSSNPITVHLSAAGLPGVRCGDWREVRVGLQVRTDAEGLVPGDAPSAQWATEVRAKRLPDGTFDFLGPAVHGRRGERFIYLTWLGRLGDEPEAMFRRAKLQLDGVATSLVEAAVQGGHPLRGHLPSLTDACGLPLCASVRPPVIEWSVST